LFRAAIGEAMAESGRRALIHGLGFLAPNAKRERTWLAGSLGKAVSTSEWHAALAAEYVWMASEVIDAGEGELVGADGAPARGWLPARYLLKPNTTRRLFAERTERLQHASGRSCAETFEAPPPFGLPEKIRTVFGPNSLGQVLFQIAHANTAQSFRCRTATNLAATRALLAMRIWETEHRAIPPDLAALVPDPLRATPLDAFNGQLLRYDPPRRQIWSVGNNLIDEGGAGDDLVWTLPEATRGGSSAQALAFP